MGASLNPGLYIHIPFCKKKCNYCDFLSFGKDCCDKKYGNGAVDAYFESLLREIDLLSDYARSGNTVCGAAVPLKFDSVYVGGGTPSFVSEDLISKTIERIYERFDISSDAEITIESNPGTLSEDKLKAYRHSGINRVSIGIQSLNDSLLSHLGRIHDRADAVSSVISAKKYFDNVNVDFITAIPGDNKFIRPQTIDDINDTLDFIIESKLSHVSCYSLIIEPGTDFYDRSLTGSLGEIDDLSEREMYYTVMNRLTENGYVHYEISNYAIPGRESRHNLKYWSGAEYLGIGLGAVSFLKEAGSRRYIRFRNETRLDRYIQQLSSDVDGSARTVQEILDTEERKKEFMLLGFRKTAGPDRNEYKELFGSDFMIDFADILGKLNRDGFINSDCSLTEKGYDFENEISAEFL